MPKLLPDVNPELLLGGKYGHALHVWDLNSRRHLQRLDLGPEYQMVLELRPAHDPNETYGFVGVVTSLKDLSSSIWMWHREGNDRSGTWHIHKAIEIPAEPAAADDLPPLLKGFGAVPPLVTDLNLSLDDRFLYVSCWGTGELKQFDVSDPFNPLETGSVKLGGIVRRQSHPSRPDQPLNGAPQMVEISRDGKRLYVTNSLYRTWDEQFYPDGIKGWWPKSMCARTAVSNSIAPDSWSSTACVHTRSTWRAAMPAPIPTASREGCIMPIEMTSSWAVLMALGAFHGINPGMGWLFAVALGLQERRRSAVLRALVPLGAGHALAVCGAVAAALAIGAVIPAASLRWPLAVVLVSLGVLRSLRHRHRRWAGMRVSMKGLTLWSFLMATAHGAGLMVIPVFVGMSMTGDSGHAHHMGGTESGVGSVLLATSLHAVGYLLVTALIAVLVFEKLGVGILRRAWINLDVIWAAALMATGMLTLML